MHTFQLNAQINEHGILSVTLPKEWAKQSVNILLVLEPQADSTDAQQRKLKLKASLNNAVSLNIFDGVDGVEWQKVQRQDRALVWEE